MFSVSLGTKMTASYQIKLPQFEGPFDLLLFFIQRDELDIYDIPISKIAKDFLDYIQMMESLNIDLASEFIFVAATLMRIKSRLLLPRKEVDEEGNEIDPREELVQRLLEYKKYKSVLEEMRDFEESRSKKFPRGNVIDELKGIATKALVDVELESLTLFKLLKTFESSLVKFEERNKKTVHKVYRYPFTVRSEKAEILNDLKIGKQTKFTTIFSKCKNRVHAIVVFLAVLELANLEQIQITIGEGINNFWVTKFKEIDSNQLESSEFDSDESIENTDEK